ncbi:thiopurine S-methyltransferase [Methylovirgula ligni]|uniref:Thiopurine S-methyltransferase n=1 Tax=Methylovirgula ligni TaxID=569860 RepID=A0A3D9YMK2_9HYPH|nr:thiopurine S-methyltransferase [Methylovirgula ligni]QAY96755.1 thiopurine S-methyltransferase [Methylovirgula ligni]REF83198.1 thiopurine S-methyltransferase [Methylovirgula ligni]
MDAQFWHNKWQRGEIGFHQTDANPLLSRNLPALGLAQGARLFLPLCGKTRDIHWLLAGGFQVVGVELSPLAVEQLFAELGIVPRVSTAGALRRHEADGLTIFAGDIFALDRDALGRVDAIYDRAALVALPGATRTLYAAHLLAITNRAPQFVITFDYDQSRMDGPPFSVNEAEMRGNYENAYRLSSVESSDIPGGLKGFCPARETLWLLEPR